MYSAESIDSASETRSAPVEQQMLAAALADLATHTRFPVVLGGFARGDQVVVAQLIGNRSDTLRGLSVRTGSGLGGRVLQEARPRFVADYRNSRTITHDYDRPVLAEGITAFFAVPVLVGGVVRAVLYGGLRTAVAAGDVSIDAAVAVAQRFARRLAECPVDSLAAASIKESAPMSPASVAGLEELRRVYAEIRTISAALSDPVLRARLEAVERRISVIASGPGGRLLEAGAADSGLTARELDVLSIVALGCTNAAVGEAIGLTEATVKSYMNTAMRKLGATTRYEAVAMARRRELLP